jgi:hypothetical protein
MPRTTILPLAFALLTSSVLAKDLSPDSITEAVEAHKNKEAFTKWLKDNPEHPVAPFARFSFAHSQLRAGDGDAGRKLLKEILAKDSLRSTLLDDAQLWLGVSHNWERNNAEAAKAFGVLMRDYPASSSAKQVAGKFPPAPPVTE